MVVADNDARSRAETARLAELSAQAGFTAPAVAALARASAAEGSALATQQRAACELLVKALVALSALPEPQLRQKLAVAWTEPSKPAVLTVASVPAQVLVQRPDVYQAEREVAAASAEVGSARAQRFPRLSLFGSIAAGNVRTGGVSTDLQTWSIGPLAVTLPIFDGGRRAADVDAAQARYEEAAALYAASVRQAVREVEEALVTLESTRLRDEDARTAAENYRVSFVGTEARYRSGLASLVELEDIRRSALVAETALVLLQRERAGSLDRPVPGPGRRLGASRPRHGHDRIPSLNPDSRSMKKIQLKPAAITAIAVAGLAIAVVLYSMMGSGAAEKEKPVVRPALTVTAVAPRQVEHADQACRQRQHHGLAGGQRGRRGSGPALDARCT